MKKYLIIGLFSLVVIFLIVLFINISRYSVIECSHSVVDDNYSIKNNYKIYYKNDIVDKVMIVREIESNNNTVLSFFDNNYKEEYNKLNKEYGGYKIISDKKDKQKIVLNVLWDLDFVNMSNLLKEKVYLKDDIVNKRLKVSGVYKLFNLSKKNCS